MITGLIKHYEEGNILLLDALIEMEKHRVEIEKELLSLKEFKYSQSNEIDTASMDVKDGYKGYTFEVRSGRTTWNFKGIDEWDECSKNKSDCEKKYKALFNAKVAGGIHANISADGEELKLPEISYGKPSVIVKEQKI